MQRQRRVDVLEVRRFFENKIQRALGIEHAFRRNRPTVFVFDAHVCQDRRRRKERFLKFGSVQGPSNPRRRHHEIGLFNQRSDSRIVVTVDDIHAILQKNRRKIARRHGICGIRMPIRAVFGLPTAQIRHHGNATAATNPLERNPGAHLATAKNEQTPSLKTHTRRFFAKIAKTELFERPKVAIARAQGRLNTLDNPAIGHKNRLFCVFVVLHTRTRELHKANFRMESGKWPGTV